MDQGRIIHQGHFDEIKDLQYFRVMLDNTHQDDYQRHLINYQINDNHSSLIKIKQHDSDSENIEENIN